MKVSRVQTVKIHLDSMIYQHSRCRPPVVMSSTSQVPRKEGKADRPRLQVRAFSAAAAYIFPLAAGRGPDLRKHRLAV